MIRTIYVIAPLFVRTLMTSRKLAILKYIELFMCKYPCANILLWIYPHVQLSHCAFFPLCNLPHVQISYCADLRGHFSHVHFTLAQISGHHEILQHAISEIVTTENARSITCFSPSAYLSIGVPDRKYLLSIS